MRGLRIEHNQYIVDSKTIMYIQTKGVGKNPDINQAVLLFPSKISIGDNVVMERETWINGIGGVEIGNDVKIGPQTVIPNWFCQP